MLPSQVPADPATSDPASEELKALLVQATGNFRLSGKNSPVMEKVRHRLKQNGLESLGAYLELLKKGDAGKRELDSLIAELTVGETFFFRHPDHFDALRDHVLPACLKRNEASRQLRIWSAGCANGAEAYSIAILVHSLLGPRLKDWNVTIVGSDINRAFLAEAEEATYSAWTLRGVPTEQVSGYFERAGSLWSLRAKYKQNVHFVYHNIINEEMPSIHKNIFAFDIVFCRNVMIYFDDVVNNRLVARIEKVMVDGGWLFVGSTDFNPHLDATFTSEKHSGALFYRKVAPVAPPREDPQASASVVDLPVRRVTAALPAAGPKAEQRRRRVAESIARDQQAPARLASAPPANTTADIAAIVELANRGDWKSAAQQCETLLATDSVSAPAYYYYALVLQSTGAHAEAEQALKRAIYLDRGFALAHYQLGLARKDAHDLPACRRALRNALEALETLRSDRTISPCGQITAGDLRELVTQQLELLGGR